MSFTDWNRDNPFQDVISPLALPKPDVLLRDRGRKCTGKIQAAMAALVAVKTIHSNVYSTRIYLKILFLESNWGAEKVEILQAGFTLLFF